MIFIGGSLGGCDAAGEILRRLPATFRLPIAVVLHRHRDSDGLLQPVVQRTSVLPVAEVDDKEEIKGGHVYLCPPDYHLLVEAGRFALSTDDPFNFARPSLDVCLESAAEWWREKLIAIILSGAGSDGAQGARTVQAKGGVVIVQDPATAEGAWMPAAAIAATGTRHVMTLDRIARALVRLARRRSATSPDLR